MFYRFRSASDVYVQFDTFGSGYDTSLAVYARNRAGDAQLRRGCERYTVDGWAGIRLEARAGVKYFFMVGSRQGVGVS